MHRSIIVLATVLTMLIMIPRLGQAAPPAQGPPPLGPSDATLIDRLRRETGGTGSGDITSGTEDLDEWLQTAQTASNSDDLVK